MWLGFAWKWWIMKHYGIIKQWLVIKRPKIWWILSHCLSSIDREWWKWASKPVNLRCSLWWTVTQASEVETQDCCALDRNPLDWNLWEATVVSQYCRDQHNQKRFLGQINSKKHGFWMMVELELFQSRFRSNLLSLLRKSPGIPRAFLVSPLLKWPK